MDPNRSAIPLYCGVVTAALGTVVLAGWYLHAPNLIQVHPSFAPMQYNTALVFLFCGLGLCFLKIGKLDLCKILGSLAALLGGLTQIEYIFEINLGIDQLFMEHYITTKTSHPGRMAPTTALCFILSGLALYILGISKKTTKKIVFAAILTLTILVLSSGAFLGYIVRLETAYGWGNLTRMALHTSFGFIFIAIGFMILIEQWGKPIFKEFPLLRPLLSSAAVLLLSISISVAQYIQEDQRTKRDIKNIAGNIIGMMETPIKLQTNALIRMAKRVERGVDDSQSVWEADAKNYLDNFSSLMYLKFVGPDNRDRWVVSSMKHSREGTPNTSIEQIKSEAHEKSRETGSVWFSQSIELTEETREIEAIIPIFTNDSLKGFIVAGFNLNHLLNSIFLQKPLEGFSLNVYENDKKIFQIGIPKEHLHSDWSHQQEVNLYNTHWLTDLRPTQEWFSKNKSFLPQILFVFGLFMSYLFGLTIYFSQQAEMERENIEKIKLKNELILSSAGEGIYGLDLEGKTTFANPTALKTLGYSAEELLGKPQHALIHHSHPDGSHYPREDCPIYAALIDGKVHRESNEVFWQKNGTPLPVEYVSTPIRENDELIGAVVTFKDISERKRSERIISSHMKDLKHANEMLFTSNKELDDFAYIVSHDLKEPLRGIYNFATFIKEDYEDKLNEEGNEKLDTLVRLSQRMEALINSILHYARLGRADLEVKAINLNKVIEDVLDNLQTLMKESKVEVRIPKPLPATACDGTLMKEVIQNLLINAIKYNDKPRKWVEIGCHSIECLANGNENNTNGSGPSIFYVKDNGIGIHEKYFDSLFRIFKRLNGRKKFSDGTGAGTTIVKKIIEKHNGKIWLESTLGEGTTFYFTLEKTNHEHYQPQALDSHC